MAIEIDISLEPFERTVGGLISRLTDTHALMQDIGEQLLESVKQHIESGRDWTGAPFEPNSQRVAARKGRNRPLIDTGEFLNSRLYYQAGRDHVEIGASAVQAAVLQFGAEKGQFGRAGHTALPWGDIPSRRYLPVTKDGSLDAQAAALIGEIVRDFLS